MLYFKIDYDGNPDPTSGNDRGGDYSATNPPFWDNNSLWLRHDGADQTSVHVNDNTKVTMRITNYGPRVSSQVHVQAWVFQPFVGQVTPGDAITDDSGVLIAFQDALNGVPSGSGASTEDAGQVDTHVSVAGTGTGSGYWKPTPQELTKYGSHLCIAANVYTLGDGSELTTGTPFATTSYTDDNGPHGRDAHHGQRNIALLPSAEPQQVMPFQVRPPLLQGQPTLLDIHALGSVNIGAGEHWLLQSRTNVTKINNRQFVIPGGRGRPATPLSYSRKGLQGTLALERFGEIDLAEASKATKAALKRSDGSALVPFSKTHDGARIRLESLAEPHTATITLKRDDSKGSMQALDIVQRTEDGQVLGGIRILSLVTGTLR